jgi:hypothetical protein
MNSIAKSTQTSHPSRFMRHLSAAATEYQRARGVFGKDSAEAKTAWCEWQEMRRIMQAQARNSR